MTALAMNEQGQEATTHRSLLDAVAQDISVHCVPDRSVEDHPDAIAQVAKVALMAVPDGWAKVEGVWIRIRPRTPDNSAGRRLFEED